MTTATELACEAPEGQLNAATFAVVNGRLPHIGDAIKPWEYRGWLLPYVQMSETALRGDDSRWAYLFECLETGRLPARPIPRLSFTDEDTLRSKASVQKQLHSWAQLVGYDLGGWSDFRSLVDWFLWGLALSKTKPVLYRDDAWEALYRAVDVSILLRCPSDHFGALISEWKGNGFNPLGFYPTPHEVVECMVRMQFDAGSADTEVSEVPTTETENIGTLPQGQKQAGRSLHGMQGLQESGCQQVLRGTPGTSEVSSVCQAESPPISGPSEDHRSPEASGIPGQGQKAFQSQLPSRHSGEQEKREGEEAYTRRYGEASTLETRQPRPSTGEQLQAARPNRSIKEPLHDRGHRETKTRTGGQVLLLQEEDEDRGPADGDSGPLFPSFKGRDERPREYRPGMPGMQPFQTGHRPRRVHREDGSTWVDQRHLTVCDPCLGTGRMLLRASNYSMRLYGTDIDQLVLNCALINFALYAPWGAFPLSEVFWAEQEKLNDGESEPQPVALPINAEESQAPQEIVAAADGAASESEPQRVPGDSGAILRGRECCSGTGSDGVRPIPGELADERSGCPGDSPPAARRGQGRKSSVNPTPLLFD